MRILFDHCVDRNFRQRMTGHAVRTAREMGWAQLRNGLLLAAAEAAGFDVLLTVDKGFRHQQSLAGMKVSVVLFRGKNTKLATLTSLLPAFDALVPTIQPGQLYEIPALAPPPPTPPPAP